MSVELCSNSCTTFGIVDCIRFYLLLRLSPFMRLRSFLFLCTVASSIHLHEEIHATIDLCTACVHFWVYGNFQACKHYGIHFWVYGNFQAACKHYGIDFWVYGNFHACKHLTRARHILLGVWKFPSRMQTLQHILLGVWKFPCMQTLDPSTAYTFGCMEISMHANT